MTDNKKRKVFERWMKNVQHLEPEFYVKDPILPPMTHWVEKDGQWRIETDGLAMKEVSKLDSLSKNALSSMFIRGASTEDGQQEHIVFTFSMLRSADGRVVRLCDIDTGKEMTSFDVFCGLLDLSKKNKCNVFCVRYWDSMLNQRSGVFISPETSFEEMQIEADLKEIEKS